MVELHPFDMALHMDMPLLVSVAAEAMHSPWSMVVAVPVDMRIAMAVPKINSR